MLKFGLLQCRMALAPVLGEVEFTSQDEDRWNHLRAAAEAQSCNVLDIAVAEGRPLSPGVFATIIAGQIYYWDDGGQAGAEWLFPIFESLSGGATEANILVRRVCRVVALIGKAETTLAERDEDNLPDELRWELIEALVEGAEICCQPYPAAAYDLCDLAVSLFGIGQPLSDPRAEGLRPRLADVVSWAARASRKPAQIATAAIMDAYDAIAAANNGNTARISAYTRCETAVERVIALPIGTLRSALSEMLARVLGGEPWTRALVMFLAPDLTDHSRHQDMVALLGVTQWLPRVTSLPTNEWLAELQHRIRQASLEQLIEQERLALEPTPPEEAPLADWLDWRVYHPAYRRAVPHNRSFFREKNFPDQLLTLVHELTHVFSFFGAIGYALIALQIAATASEFVIRGKFHTAPSESSDRTDGLAQLAPGDGTALVFAEYQLGIVSKMLILLEVWRPWFEGLAVFAETATDPLLDPNGINDVLLCLRGLMDPEPAAEGKTPNGPGEWRRRLEEFVSDFEVRCSAAMKARGPWRLRQEFGVGGPVYFGGYLAVRSIVSAWRSTLGRIEPGTTLFVLLLHATRFGTFDAIPDLSLPVEEFAQDAERRMAEWATELSKLPASDIDNFLKSDGPNEPGRPYRWIKGRLFEMPQSEQPTIETITKDYALDTLRSAFRSHTFVSIQPANSVDHFAAAIDGMIQDLRHDFRSNVVSESSLLKWLEIYISRVQLNALVPIGRSASNFSLNTNDDDSWCQLWTNLRTTEEHFQTGRPSVNGLIVPIEKVAATTVASFYKNEGAPRIEVTRIIDVGNTLFEEGPQYAHFFAFDYGDWFDVRPAVAQLDELWRKEAERRDNATKAVQRRLHPIVIDGLDTAVAARGIEPTLRNLAWLEASNRWVVGTDLFDELKPWAADLKRLCHDILSNDSAARRRSSALRALMAALFPTAPGIVAAAETGLWAVTAKKQSDRDRIIEALQVTGFRSAESDWLDAHAARVADYGLPIFERTASGWDVVRPSVSGTGTAA